MVTNQQEKLKLNWLERRALNNLIKKAEKKLNDEKTARAETEKMVMELGKFYELEFDDGTVVTEADLKTMSNSDLVNLGKIILDDFKRAV